MLGKYSSCPPAGEGPVGEGDGETDGDGDGETDGDGDTDGVDDGDGDGEAVGEGDASTAAGPQPKPEQSAPLLSVTLPATGWAKTLRRVIVEPAIVPPPAVALRSNVSPAAKATPTNSSTASHPPTRISQGFGLAMRASFLYVQCVSMRAASQS
jgi:hypothetical protein